MSRRIVGLRDRALIALLVYTFARVSRGAAHEVEDYYPQGKRWWVRLHEKGGKQHEMPAHHLLEHYLDAYVGGCARRSAQTRSRRCFGRSAGADANNSGRCGWRGRMRGG